MAEYAIRSLTPADRVWMRRFFQEHWGGETIVVHGTVYHPMDLPGFVAEAAGCVLGLVTYTLHGKMCEIVSLDSVRRSEGIGTALLAQVRQMAEAEGCRRLWLVTSNDNLNALRFYQRRGFLLVAVHPDAVTAARLLKPTIPLVGDFGIPLRDELELEIRMS